MSGRPVTQDSLKVGDVLVYHDDPWKNYEYEVTAIGCLGFLFRLLAAGNGFAGESYQRFADPTHRHWHHRRDPLPVRLRAEAASPSALSASMLVDLLNEAAEALEAKP